MSNYRLRGFGLVSDDPPCCAPFKLDAASGKCLDATGYTPSFLVSGGGMMTQSHTPYAGEPVPQNWLACLRTIPGTEPVATDPSIQWGGNGSPIAAVSAVANPPAAIVPATTLAPGGSASASGCFSIVNTLMAGADTSACLGPATQITWALGAVAAFLLWRFAK